MNYKEDELHYVNSQTSKINPKCLFGKCGNLSNFPAFLQDKNANSLSVFKLLFGSIQVIYQSNRIYKLIMNKTYNKILLIVLLFTFGVHQIHTQTPILNCASTDTLGNCLSCVQGFYLNSIIGMCSQVDPTCNTYDPNSGACLSCYVGSALSGTTCVFLSNIDPNCQNFTGLICNNCFNGFYLGPNVCTQSNPVCQTYSMTTGQCLSCYAGSALSGNICVQLSVLVPYCSNFTGIMCVSCINGYYINNQSCLPGNPLCATYDMNGGNCLTCYQGYFLNGTICSVMNPLCNTVDANGNCVTCYKGFAVSGNTCISLLSINPQCSNFSGLFCTFCNNGYYIGPSGICSQVSYLCKTYNMSTGACVSCYAGSAISGTTCISLASINPQCSTFNGVICINCYQGFYIGSDGVCTAVNPKCQTYSMITGDCLSCYWGSILSGTLCS